ncbi:MAG: flagellar motor protein MotB [SAR324 cluster bacterium]|nr:flagellar motor protein MotB [SAR324 cluster bacterium]
MGQMIDEEDCEVCKPFDQEWIFTYGDLVTLLFCFFVLLVSLCKTDVEKIKQIAASFKENPPGSPFVFTGQSSNLDKAAQQLEKLDVPYDVEINDSDKGVEVTFRRTVSFEQGSIEISEKAIKAMKKMLPIIGQMQNDIEISGHTDDTDINNRFPSNWEMSVARASAIAGFLEANKIAPKRMQVVGYGDSRPRFNADTAYKRALNRRVDILLLPEEQTR